MTQPKRQTEPNMLGNSATDGLTTEDEGIECDVLREPAGAKMASFLSVVPLDESTRMRRLSFPSSDETIRL
ncbi:hypothetical protein FVEN_g12926 [Fusarium venenatum]|uniref:Uncharacterized protein n=1 Tax=Fusarium venenatum TaxID=56646 RepID=A0A2L2T968_9HYPO|nr:uncharacterized protein FVRRES_03050 [Fusarium venenatum]KAG8353771.1 hypothetical protein FVEN_g12926 [Fusarium venenatum]CEI66538.1 unnamed protein product [Fusarium venenatum]